MGKDVGAVRSVGMSYDAQSGEITTKVTIALDPARIEITGVQMASAGNDARGALDGMIGTLVEKGLRAELDSSMPVIGGKLVALKMVPGARPAVLGGGAVPEIPSVPGSSIDSIMASVGEITGKVNQIPLDAIGQDVQRTMANAARLSSSPELTESIHHLDESLANIQEMSRQARAQVGPFLAEVHRAAKEAESTLASAKSLMGSSLGQGQPQSAGLPQTLYELERAARSLRELADYLDRHPESLLRGKGTNG
jgi:paraquat-inducible protein B